MPKFIDLTGQKFGKLTVLYRVNDRNRTSWKCKCSCGSETITTALQLRNGGTRSCGCLKRENNGMRTHGMSRTRTYSIWCGMINRCRNPNEPAFNRYGGRGIDVCQRWNYFENFLNDMGKAPDGLTIERINNDLGYSPENCKWASYKEQARNTRHHQPITFAGRTMHIIDWAAKIGINESSLRCRIGRLGWSLERALTTPKR